MTIISFGSIDYKDNISLPFSGTYQGNFTGGSSTLTFTGNTLQIGDTASLQLTGYAASTVTYQGQYSDGTVDYPLFSYDAAGNTNGALLGATAFQTYTIVDTPYTACFARGTLIACEAGPVAVEQLTAGTRVTLARGGSACVTWVGHRSIDVAGHAAPAAVRPIRVAAGGFGPGLPMRDLVLSPEHAVFVDGVLVPVKHLVNGGTIAPVDWDTVTYFHVRLDAHDILLAEGLPAESYLDDEDHAVFDNAADAPQALAVMVPCAPRLTQGVELEAIRARLHGFVSEKKELLF
jgi:hypothetical protein